jgi:hypothetical protein
MCDKYTYICTYVFINILLWPSVIDSDSLQFEPRTLHEVRINVSIYEYIFMHIHIWIYMLIYIDVCIDVYINIFMRDLFRFIP